MADAALIDEPIDEIYATETGPEEDESSGEDDGGEDELHPEETLHP
jgi:hypothetical protein